MLIVLGFILYAFTSGIFRKEEPKIVLEEENEISHPDVLSSKGISVVYYNTTFRVEILKFSSLENRTTFINDFLNFTNSSAPIKFENMDGYSYFATSTGGEPFSGYLLNLNISLLNCYLLPKKFPSIEDYQNSLAYLKEVCKWFIEKKLSDYL